MIGKANSIGHEIYVEPQNTYAKKLTGNSLWGSNYIRLIEDTESDQSLDFLIEYMQAKKSGEAMGFNA